MIRTVITPNKDSIVLTIPKGYVGKQIEVLVYSTEEASDTDAPIGDIGSLRGSMRLGEKRMNDFLRHVKQIRDEWERDT